MLPPTSQGGHLESPGELPPLAIPTDVRAILDVLWEQGHAALVVGGAVRDTLLGLPTGDWDVATDARPERILELFPEGTYENRFGTVLARGVEITTFRRDHRYADHRRPERVTFTDDVYEDLARRDLTINAIAWGRSSAGAGPRLVDPADGLADLRDRVVRAVGDPDARFDEDALRLLRAVRIAARLGFEIESLTFAALRAHAGDVSWVSEERVGAELRRMLAADTPSHAFRLLAETAILDVVLPELGAHGSFPERFERTMTLLDGVARSEPGDERLALAALLLEVGRDGRLAVDAGPGPREGLVVAILRRLRVPLREAELVSRLIDVSTSIDATQAWSDTEVRRFMQRAGPELLEDALRLQQAVVDRDGAAADGPGLAALRVRIASQQAAAVPLALADLAVDGHVLREALGLPEGPDVGRILSLLLEAVIEDPGRNEQAALIELARDWLAGGAVRLAHGVGSGE